MRYSESKDPAVVAEEAAQLLDNQLLQEAFEIIETGVVDQMKTAPIIGNPEAEAYRDKLILSLQVVDSVLNQLRSYVDTGRIKQAFNNKEI